MELAINNTVKAKIDKKKLKKLAGLAGEKGALVSLSFVTRRKMKSLNRRYRGKDRPTDVLSFNMDEGKLLGDVLICPDVAKSNAREYGVTFDQEVARLTVHGLLHLKGMDHGKKMFDMQDRILRRAGYA
jgi:probable rRNA maturation factor